MKAFEGSITKVLFSELNQKHVSKKNIHFFPLFFNSLYFAPFKGQIGSDIKL